MIRVEVKSRMFRWARDRSGVDQTLLAKRFPKLEQCEAGEVQPTLKQLENFAKATHTSVGYLLLEEPPEETVPIPDFRTGYGAERRPSPDLLETIYVCQQRQEWYRDFARSVGLEPLPFVGSVQVTSSVTDTAAEIRDALDIDVDERGNMGTWSEALRAFVEQADAAGILVMRSGIVGSNTHRRLDPEDFRGFALADALAPLVFINGADTKSAQMFTLAHEIAHLWLNQSAVTDAEARTVPENEVERWCNRVAAEVLVPLDVLRDAFRPNAELPTEIVRLARQFKVSTLVVLRRIRDAGGLDRDAFWEAYDQERARLLSIERGGAGGGDFYKTLPARVSKRFARALVSSTLEGKTMYTDALQLLGFSRLNTLDELAHRLDLTP